MIGSPMKLVACFTTALLERMMLDRWRTPSTTWVWSMTSANSFAVCR